MTISISQIARYPIKGLSAEALPRVALTPGRTIPGDRRFAIRHGKSAFDPASPTWQPKTEFLMLAREEQLAAIATSLDLQTGHLRLSLGSQFHFEGNVFTPAGRAAADKALNTLLPDSRGALSMVDAGQISLTDCQVARISFLNPASARDLAAKTGHPVDCLRFRGNILIDGLAPWAEFDWVGKTLSIGSTRLFVQKRIQRCAAITVNPATAQRDINLLKSLQDHYGHVDFGIYAVVESGGDIAVGDPIVVT